MFQTGYDEPLLHTMYVDKMLYDIKAVQTLSRLNRACPKKYDTFVLDFFNDPDDIIQSFSRYYKTTLLSGETDPNKLYDLIAEMETDQVYTDEQVEHLVRPVSGRRGPRPAGPGAGCVRGPVQAAGHGQADQVQERRERLSCAPTGS